MLNHMQDFIKTRILLTLIWAFSDYKICIDILRFLFKDTPIQQLPKLSHLKQLIKGQEDIFNT